MSITRFFKTHRSWEDWVGMLLGVLIGISPWLAEQQSDQVVMWNAILVGALVLLLAQLEYVSLQRWEEIGEIVLGLWLIASPFTFGYGRCRPAAVLAFRSRRHHRADCRLGALAGLETDRQGVGSARSVARRDTHLRYLARFTTRHDLTNPACPRRRGDSGMSAIGP
jgi:SPW repeat